MRKKSIILLLIFVIIMLFSSCSINHVKNKYVKTLVIESDAKLNGGIYSGSLELVKEAIEDGANLNKIKVTYVSKENPVIIALLNNQNRIAEYLIESGADVNYTDS